MAKQFSDDVQFLGRVTFDTIPDAPPTKLTPASTVPNVSNYMGVTKGGGSVVTVTNFVGGSDGQRLVIQGDGATTISNNANIKTNTGANKLLAVNRIYVFYYSDTDHIWYEH